MTDKQLQERRAYYLGVYIGAAVPGAISILTRGASWLRAAAVPASSTAATSEAQRLITTSAAGGGGSEISRVGDAAGGRSGPAGRASMEAALGLSPAGGRESPTGGRESASSSLSGTDRSFLLFFFFRAKAACYPDISAQKKKRRRPAALTSLASFFFCFSNCLRDSCGDAGLAGAASGTGGALAARRDFLGRSNVRPLGESGACN